MSDPKPLTILLVMVSAHPGIGGMEKHTIEMANGLALAGHSVAVMCAAQHQTGLVTDVEPITLNPTQSRYSPRLLAHIYQQFRGKSYDIVHAQGTKAAALLATLSHLPMKPARIASFHNFKSRYPSLQRFNAVIAVSKALAQHLPTLEVQVVYNGLQINHELTPADPQLADTSQKPVWLAVGRLVNAKGFDFLIDSFKDVNGCLYIAGDGPDKALLQQKIRDNELQHRVTLLGHRDDIPALMAACDGVVISSRREGFSYVFAEAILASKPVISTNVPIANEFLPEHHIYHGSSPDGFAKLLNSDLGVIFNEQITARERAQRELTLDSMINSTLAVYHAC